MCDSERWSFIRDKKKRRWLERRGYRPMTDDILVEQSRKIFDQFPERADRWVKGARGTFTHYRRYGNEIVPYIKGYLENTDLSELKRKHRRNIMLFVNYRMSPIRWIRHWYFRSMNLLGK